ncbi:MAG: type II toxin-antitoxin system HicB family antitoxin [Chloroflexota bacterium]|nr:type II toxin-antitoxin system HicB family antitoxin [Chloroflexota bacterium]
MTEYIHAVLRYAKFEILLGSACIATFPTLAAFHKDVYAHGDTMEQCAVALQYELESFVLLAVRDGLPLPEVDVVPPPSLEAQHDSLVVDPNG